MLNLTRQEQNVILVVMVLLFLGLAVKFYRMANGPDTVAVDSKK